MFVYFIFYDDFGLYDMDNDHQNILPIKLSLKRSTSDDNATKEESNKFCTLCLEEIKGDCKIESNEKGRMLDNNEKEEKKPPLCIFKDMSLYDYDNNEYIHTCDCRTDLHCACFLLLYNMQRSCVICKKEIIWKYRKLEESRIIKLRHIRLSALELSILLIKLSLYLYIFFEFVDLVYI